MNKQALSLAVFIAGAYPAASNALGLGDIESSSHLNQPLRAKIDLLAAAPADASQIQVRLASPDVFNRVGVARPQFLSTLSFTPTVQGGKPVILVTSDVPMQEPFVNFLLEVSWPQGQLLKEYTVMLDPPVLMQPGNTVAGEASVRAEPKSAGTVRRPQPQAAQQATGATPARQVAQGGARTYRVKPGDTLFRVASRLQQPGVSNDQMMMALFRANPGAFIDNNINNLKSGATLKAPASRDASAVSRAEARRAIRQQNAEWRELRKTLAKNTVSQKATAVASNAAVGNATPPAAGKTQTATAKTPDKARLEVLGAKEGQDAAGNAAVAAGNAKLTELEKQLSLARESLTARQNENNELKSRVRDLESLMSKKDRLIALRDEQLAGLQKQLGDKGIAVPPLAGETETAAQPVEPPVAETDQGKDIQTHVANVTGQGNDAVMRGDQQQAATSALVPSAPGQPQPPVPAQDNKPVETVTAETAPVRQTPASMAVGNSRIPLTPPAPNQIAEPVKPAVVPVTPAPDNAANKQPAPVFADQENSNGDLMSLLTSPLALQIGAGSLALLLLLWLLGRRRKPADGRTDYKAADFREDPEIGGGHDGNRDTFDLGTLENELDKAEARGHEDDAYDASKDPFGTGAGDAWGDETGNAQDAGLEGHEGEDDLLTEANVYIAYGLYQQAESELKKGIERHPERLEYRHKLLECYFVANNREAFDRQASQFAALDGNNKESLWKAIAEWGRKISPDNALYQDGGLGKAGVAATVAAAVGGVAAAAAARAGDPVKPEPAVSGDDFELDLDNSLAEFDADLEQAHTGAVAAKPVSDEFDDLDLGDLDFDDLDLDKLLQDDDKPAASGVTHQDASVVPDFDDDLPDLPDFDGMDAGKPAFAMAEPGPALEMDLDDLDFDLDLDTDKPAIIEASAPVAAVDDNLLDFITEDSDATGALTLEETAKAPETKAAHAANLNLHLDNNSGLNRILPKDTFYAPAETGEEDWLGDIDDALSFLDFPDEEIDLHEAHISTKLDLARAYLDMGDIEGARSTLEEVMVEGNDDQRREAEVLLHQTG